MSDQHGDLMAEPVRVRRVSEQEGQPLQRIVRRSSTGSGGKPPFWPRSGCHPGAVLISPMPGADRRNVRQALNYVWTEAVNARTTTSQPDDLCLKYLSWAVEAATHMRSQVSARDIDRLILTRRYPAFNDPFGALRRGDVGVLVVWLPVEEADLTVGPVLYAEPLVLAVDVNHELAGRTSISLDVVSDFQHHPDVESRSDYWFDSYVPSHARNGRSIQRGPLVRHGRDRHLLPGPHGAVRDTARHRLYADSRPGAPAVCPRLAQRSRNRPHPRPRPDGPRSWTPYRHREHSLMFRTEHR